MSAAVRPTPGAVRPWEFPAVHRHRLANGLSVVIAPMHRLPLVSVLAVVDAGAATDPAGQEGVAALAARALTEGTAGIDGAALADKLEGLGTSLGGFADWDSSMASFTVMPQRLEAAFGLFVRVLTAPTYPAADVMRKRDERLADLEQQLAEPRGLADLRFTGFLFDAASRYACSASGTAASVSGLQAEQVRAFHAARYAPAQTTIVMTGDITPEQGLALVERELGGWSAQAAVAPGIEAAEAASTRRVVVIEKADAPQSELRVGHLGLERSHPDYLSVVVMNAIFGGLFSSRINLNLREKHAFTYGASSGFDWRRARGPFVVSTAVKSEVTDRAVTEILREIDGMRAAPPSGSELSLAIDYLAGVFPIRYETTSAVAGALANAVVFGLPDDWFGTYRTRIQTITAEMVHQAAVQHLDPSRLLVLAVGDPTVVRAPLEALGIGPLSAHAASEDPTSGVAS